MSRLRLSLCLRHSRSLTRHIISLSLSQSLRRRAQWVSSRVSPAVVALPAPLVLTHTLHHLSYSPEGSLGPGDWCTSGVMVVSVQRLSKKMINKHCYSAFPLDPVRSRQIGGTAISLPPLLPPLLPPRHSSLSARRMSSSSSRGAVGQSPTRAQVNRSSQRKFIQILQSTEQSQTSIDRPVQSLPTTLPSFFTTLVVVAYALVQ